eukprot:c8607_g1_i2.p1 GENE.c8607_g1_i2~~c8607_g1_i2.p1  ORF type:complete len:273 (+),score=44.75 c8607_g1_i2:1427-2245(+)
MGVISFSLAASDATCSLSLVFMSFGFTTAYGTLFMKTWRILQIFHNVTMQKRALTNTFLLRWLSVVIGIDGAIILSIFLVNRPTTKVIYLSETQQMETCDFGMKSIPIAVMFCYKAIMVIYGVVIAVKVHRTFQQYQRGLVHDAKKADDFNDSAHIGYCLYNVFLLCVVLVPTILALPSSQYVMQWSLLCVFMFACSQFNVVLLFVPKIAKLFTRSAHSGQKQSSTRRLYSVFVPRGSLVTTAPTKTANAMLMSIKTSNTNTNSMNLTETLT